MEAEKKAGMDTNKLHVNFLKRLLNCSATMHSSYLRKTIPVLRTTESMFTIRKVYQDKTIGPVLKFSSDGNCHTRNKHEIFLHIFNLLIHKR